MLAEKGEKMFVSGKTKMERRVVFALLVVFLFGCSGVRTEKKPEAYPTSMAFEASYNKTWEALLSAVNDYPVLLIDQEKGVINTDWLVYIKKGSRFQKERTRLTITVKTEKEKITIDITSQLEEQSSRPFTKWKPIQSNGKRENQILKEVKARLGPKTEEPAEQSPEDPEKQTL